MDRAITKNLLRRLQTLYGQLARHWASEQTGRAIASFSDLTFEESKTLIDGLQGQLGVRAPLRKRRRLSRDAAQRAGTEGRRGNTSNDVTMAGPAEFARINYALDLLAGIRSSSTRCCARRARRWASAPRPRSAP
jgi:hypothetical protein